MKLEYNILWIDNDLQDYIDNGEIDKVKSFLEELGFEPNIIPVVDEGNLDQYLNISYDLIISDFNLNNETGDIVIYRLREEKRLDTEILFYSAKTNFVTDPAVKERLAFMERINIQIGRETLLDKIEKVISLTIRKFLELNATRGLITAATSDLDVEIESIVMFLIHKHELSDEALKEIITQKVVSPMEDRLKIFWDRYDNFQNFFHKIDAIRKWEIFRDLLKPLKSETEINTFLENNRTYQVQVIDIRNKFAHSKAERIEGRMVLKGQLGQEGFQFDTDACVEIRKNLINHKRNIEQLKRLLGS